MTGRLMSIVGFLAIGVTTLTAADIPRTSDGRPDLSGTYDVATRTPLQRPEQLGDKLTLTDEEAQAIARPALQWAEVASKRTGSDSGARNTRPVTWTSSASGSSLRPCPGPDADGSAP